MGERLYNKVLGMVTAIAGILICLICMSINVYAYTDMDYYREKLEFDSEGNLCMTTHDKKATSGITYRTIGFTIKRYDMPINAYGQQYVIVPIKQYSDIQYRDDPNNPAYIYCYYYADKQEIYNAIGRVSYDWQNQLYNYGDEVYIDEVMTVCEYGNILGNLIDSYGNYWGEVYFTYEGISNARAWAAKENLLTHFDKSVEFVHETTEEYPRYITSTITSYSYGNTPIGDFKIGAGSNHRETFDVSQGVPVSEGLYVEGKMSRYWYNIAYNMKVVTVKIPVKAVISYELRWTGYDGMPRSETKNSVKWYYVTRTCSYWELQSLDFRYLQEIGISNYAFGDRKIRLLAYKNNPQINQIKYGDYNGHVALPSYVDTYWENGGVIRENNVIGRKPSIPDTDRQKQVEAMVGKMQARSDLLTIEGQNIISDRWNGVTGESPNKLRFDETRDFYAENIVVPEDRYNMRKAVSSGTAEYISYSNGNLSEVNIDGINSVAIHTPVYVEGKISDDKKHNQQVEPDEDIYNMIIDRDFYLSAGYTGMHRDIQGYKKRNYAKYVKKLEVRFPFEVFKDDYRIKANTWIEVNALGNTKIRIPVGVKEGYYEIEYRAYALNYEKIKSYLESCTEETANYNIGNYVAVSKVNVRLSGRIFGLSVTDEEYTVGLNDENGILQYDNGHNTLPYVSDSFEDSNISFSLLSIGDFYYDNDSVNVNINYYFDDTGTNRRRVFLYEEIPYSDEYGIIKYRYEKIQSNIIIDKNNRTYVGNYMKYGVADSQRTLEGMQEWRGNINIPKNVLIIQENRETEFIDMCNNPGKSREDLIDMSCNGGYLVANLDIYAYEDKEKELSYINNENYARGFCNMWKLEGYNYVGDGIELLDGDSIIYKIERQNKDIFEIVGTH